MAAAEISWFFFFVFFSQIIGLDGKCEICVLFFPSWLFLTFGLYVAHNHRGSLCRSFVVVMALTTSAAIMGDKNSIIKSPGSALRLVFGSQPAVPIVPPLQPCPIVPFLLDTSQDLPIIIAPSGR